MIALEFDDVFMRISEGGVVFNVPPVIKVTVEKQNKMYIPSGVLL